MTKGLSLAIENIAMFDGWFPFTIPTTSQPDHTYWINHEHKQFANQASKLPYHDIKDFISPIHKFNDIDDSTVTNVEVYNHYLLGMTQAYNDQRKEEMIFILSDGIKWYIEQNSKTSFIFKN